MLICNSITDSADDVIYNLLIMDSTGPVGGVSTFHRVLIIRCMWQKTNKYHFPLVPPTPVDLQHQHVENRHLPKADMGWKHEDHSLSVVLHAVAVSTGRARLHRSRPSRRTSLPVSQLPHPPPLLLLWDLSAGWGTPPCRRVSQCAAEGAGLPRV